MAVEKNQIILEVKVTKEGEVNVDLLKSKIKELDNDIKKVGVSTKTMSKNLGNVKSATGSASGAVVELGRTISDSNYGFPAMANNVQQLATQFTFVTKEAGGFGKGLKSVFKAMTGAGGVLLLFTIGVTLLERFALNSRKAATASKELAESISAETSSLTTLVSVARNENLNKEDRIKAIDEINKKYPEYLGNVDLENISTEKTNTLIQKQINLEIARAKAKAIANKITEEQTKIVDAETRNIESSLTNTQKATSALANASNLILGTSFDVGNKILKNSKENNEEVIAESNANIERLKVQLMNVLQEEQGAVDALVSTSTSGAKAAREKLKPIFTDNVTFLELYFNFLDEAKVKRQEDVDDFIKSEKIKQKSIRDSAKAAERFERMQFINRQNSFQDLATISDNASQLIGEQTAAGKAFALATATIDTYVAANAILGDKTSTLTPTQRFLGAAAAITTGLLNVKRIMSVDAENGIKSGGGAATSNNVQAPDFNIVGASEQSQLAQTISQSEQQPIQAFVVAEDVTTAQQLDNNIIQGASLG